MRISINQPYFIPYAGFFRLFTSDVMVVLDDVQYTKQSWINRNQLMAKSGVREWLTIPLRDCPLETKIKDIEFAKDIRMRWNKLLEKFPPYTGNSLATEIKFMATYRKPCFFISEILIMTARLLGLKPKIVFSSTLNIPTDIGGQNRVIGICKHFYATEYVNAPGGVTLYSPDVFAKHGIHLKFLTPYENKSSILERITHEDIRKVRQEIDENVKFVST